MGGRGSRDCAAMTSGPALPTPCCPGPPTRAPPSPVARHDDRSGGGTRLTAERPGALTFRLQQARASRLTRLSLAFRRDGKRPAPASLAAFGSSLWLHEGRRASSASNHLPPGRLALSRRFEGREAHVKGG